jgi:hypothetical protein
VAETYTENANQRFEGVVKTGVLGYLVSINTTCVGSVVVWARSVEVKNG